jgi:hypothetical protein
MHPSTSGHSILTDQATGKRKAVSLLADESHSLHICQRTKTKILKNRSFERRFWSLDDIKGIATKSQRRAKAFRSEYPAIAKQLSRIFMETCSHSKSKNDLLNSDDEDQEEMLRDFLRDWAASNVRGLEELVTGRNMFKETRKMAVQSVLAYQQTLRDTMCVTTADRMAELLRTRSESTSHRARMFAMYLALGDALVVNTNNDECSLDDGISMQMD